MAVALWGTRPIRQHYPARHLPMQRIRPTQISEVPFVHSFPAWGVDVVESHHAENWRMELTRHDFLKMVFVAKGEGFLAFEDGTQIEAQLGDVLMVPIGQVHRLIDAPGAPMSLYVMSIQSRVLEAAALNTAAIPSGLVKLDALQSAKIETAVRRLLFEQTLVTPQTGAKVVSLCLSVIADLMRVAIHSEVKSASEAAPKADQSTNSTARMQAYVEDLREHFFEASNLDSAALALGISRRRFTQLFRKVTGTSWLAYVRKLRVEHAKRLLSHTPRTVLSIAFECGFEDLSTFYRAFKREAGSSPNQWRGEHNPSNQSKSP